MTVVEKAISFAEDHRETHVRWRDYWRAHPPTTKEERHLRRHVGGVRHHERAIGRYNVILRALRGCG